MAPAGEMWSVVIESPSTSSARAPSMSSTGCASRPKSAKNGGSWMYVESASHAYRVPPEPWIALHAGLPEKTSR